MIKNEEGLRPLFLKYHKEAKALKEKEQLDPKQEWMLVY